MMDIEEAGEEVLRGPYERCFKCGGNKVEGDVLNLRACDRCRGTGALVRHSYKLACTRVNMDYPRIRALRSADILVHMNAAQAVTSLTAARVWREYTNDNARRTGTLSLYSQYAALHK